MTEREELEQARALLSAVPVLIINAAAARECGDIEALRYRSAVAKWLPEMHEFLHRHDAPQLGDSIARAFTAVNKQGI